MANGPYRVRYAEGQRLRAADLLSEQEYLVALEKRHNLGQHAPGIVYGFDLHDDWRGLPAIRAGAAVDEDGALIVLERSEGIAGEAAECLDAWLIRCESPFRLRHAGRGSCEFDRVREQLRVITVPTAANADPIPPIDGAVYLGRSVCDDPRDLAYTAITAATVKDPANRALMQVGPATGRERNGFLVSTINDENALTPRIALDRLGTNRFLGNVTLAGYRAFASITLSNRVLVIQARRPGIGGEQIHVKVRPENQNTQLRLRFFDGLRKSERDLILPRGDGMEQAVKAFNSELVTLSLSDPPNRHPFPLSLLLRFAVEGEAPQQPRVEQDDFAISADLTLRTRGGTLDLDAWPETAAQQPMRIRGCYEPSPHDEDIGKGPNGLKFVALAEEPKAPPVPGAWAVETGTPAEPKQELRLDLGEKKDGDLSIRFSLGSIAPDGTYGDWMNINGSCLTTMPHLIVDGTIEFAPIKPDHTDINFTNLLVRAWLDGLQAAIEASTVVTVAFTGLPLLIKTGEAWNYSVQINNTSEVAITADRILETRTITGLPAPLSNVISQQVVIPPHGHANIPVAHVAGDTPAGSMSIEIRVSGKIGNAPWWRARSTDADIPVVDSPDLDVANVPDSVPRNQPWSYSFDVVNNAQSAVSLQQVTVKEGANAPVALPGTPVNLPGQQSMTFNPPQHAGMNNDLPLTIAATIQWLADGSLSNINVNRTVRARNDMTATIRETDSPAATMPWTYDLELTNTSGRALTLVSLTQHIESVGNLFPPTPPAPVVIPAVVINPSDEAVIVIDGVVAPVAGQIDVIVDLEYERNDDQRRFTIREDRRFDVT